MRFSRKRFEWRDRTGFSLVELLVVVAIIIVLFALVLSAIHRVRAAALRTVCSNNLHQIGIALQSYHATKRALPYGMSRLANRLPYLAWSARILPQLDQTPLWQATEAAYAATSQFDSNPPHIGLSTGLNVFLC